MQNVVLGAYALKLTGSAGFVGVVFFAQLGPLLFLSPAGGLLADTVDRRKLLVTSQVTQGLLSFALAAVVLLDQPPQAAIVALVFAIGIANAFGAPGPERDLAHARSTRRPARCRRAPVGPDEPLARHRARDRRRAVHRVRRGTGVRDQRSARMRSQSSG